MLFQILKTTHIKSLCKLITWSFLMEKCDLSTKLHPTGFLYCRGAQYLHLFFHGHFTSLPSKSFSTVLWTMWASLHHHCLQERFLVIDLRDKMYTGLNVYVSFLIAFFRGFLLIRHKKDIFSWYYKLTKSYIHSDSIFIYISQNDQ